ncbi:MAG: hypothetical protein AAFP15_13885 [Bacteroidota bacterium]
MEHVAGYDTVRLQAWVSDPDAVVLRLASMKETYNHEYDSWSFRGMIGSLRATVRFDKLFLEGSWPTFAGRTSLDHEATVCAVEAMEDTLGLSLREADVWRLDMCGDVSTTQAPRAYFPFLLHAPRYVRVPWSKTGVRYQLGQRHLVFYDRRARLEAQKRPIPETYGDGPVLRYEMQLRKQARRQLKLTSLTVGDLLDIDTRLYIINRWHDEYLGIEKRREWRVHDDVPSMKRSMACHGIHAYGIERLYDELRAVRDAGVLTNSQYKNQRRWVRETASHPDHTLDAPCVRELDAAIGALAQRGA